MGAGFMSINIFGIKYDIYASENPTWSEMFLYLVLTLSLIVYKHINLLEFN